MQDCEDCRKFRSWIKDDDMKEKVYCTANPLFEWPSEREIPDGECSFFEQRLYFCPICGMTFLPGEVECFRCKEDMLAERAC